jgi:ATP-dependent RNA helicase RhlE
VIVFTRSKDGATRVWRSLHSDGFYDATFIHSDRPQKDREQALADFKEGKFRIIIATDVAARGIHVDGVAHVVNFDLPLEPEDYVHRIGRTGRAEATGKATTFVTAQDGQLLKRIGKLLGKKIRPEGAPADLGAWRGRDRNHRGGQQGRSGRHGRGSRGGGSANRGSHDPRR